MKRVALVVLGVALAACASAASKRDAADATTFEAEQLACVHQHDTRETILACRCASQRAWHCPGTKGCTACEEPKK